MMARSAAWLIVIGLSCTAIAGAQTYPAAEFSIGFPGRRR